jgi:membrane protein DedA with SNARE-associated domain
VLALLVTVDGPFPVVPSEPLLMTAAAVSIGSNDVMMTAGLVLAAFLGSTAGDHMMFALGRTSQRFKKPGDGGVARWVRHNVVDRPVLTILGARFLPGGRLLSTTAAGRYGLELRRFTPCSLASSALWTGYMIGTGLLVGPITKGDPIRGLLVGCAMAAITAGMYALASRVYRLVQRRRASAEELPESEPSVPVG